MEFPNGVSASVTLWFLSTERPDIILNAEPKTDRGFGRKYLAQLNPVWPVTGIGQFPLNRSVPASVGEFYIGGFGRVSVVQTYCENAGLLSELDPRLLNSLPADTIVAYARGSGDRWEGFAGFARWEQGQLKRSLCATRDELFEDTGLPYPFEEPYWAGEKAEQIGGISLPFDPHDLVSEAEKQWLGVPIAPTGPDINIAAFAVDGRPAPKVDNSEQRLLTKEEPAPTTPALYDDYEDHYRHNTAGDELTRIAEISGKLARKAAGSAHRGLKAAYHAAKEKIRHIDRS